MSSREKTFQSDKLGKDIEKLLPIVKHGQSDTASLDNALELLVSTGRTLEHSLMMLIPEAWGDHIPMDPQKRAFYEYHSSMMEPWDGPALVIGTDGTKVCAILDRNGLRPCRYLVTKDGLLVMASETGVLDVNPEDVLYKERIYPGKMFLLETKEGKIHQDEEILNNHLLILKLSSKDLEPFSFSSISNTLTCTSSSICSLDASYTKPDMEEVSSLKIKSWLTLLLSSTI